MYYYSIVCVNNYHGEQVIKRPARKRVLKVRMKGLPSTSLGINFSSLNAYYVRMEGLEPPRREAPDPKSGAATNYATCALHYLTLHRNKQVPDF